MGDVEEREVRLLRILLIILSRLRCIVAYEILNFYDSSPIKRDNASLYHPTSPLSRE